MTTHITRAAVGWEAGSFSAFVGAGESGEWGNSSSLSVVDAATAAARSGTYGLRLHPTAGIAKQSREFNLSQVFLGRFYFKYPSSLPGANAHIFYVGAGGGAEISGAQLRFRQSDSKLICVSLDSGGGVTATAVGPVIVADTWYRIDFRKATDATFDWQIDGVAQTAATASSAFNSVFFGTNTSQTFDLYVDDLYAAYSSDDGGDTGAVLSAEYPRGEGEVKRLVAVSTSLTDASKFSMDDASDETLAHQAMDNDPLFGGPGLRQDTASATDYVEFGVTDLGVNDAPYGISVLREFRQTGGGTSDATLKITKDGTEQTVFTGNWNNGPGISSVLYLPGDSQTTPWTKAQVDAALVRWGYSGNVTNPPIIGGFGVMVDVTPVTEPEGWPDAYLGMITL